MLAPTVLTKCGWGLTSQSASLTAPLGKGSHGCGMDEAAAAGTRIVQKTQPDETGGRVMYAASEESRCILRTSDARPYGSDEMRWGRTSQSASPPAPLGKGSQGAGETIALP